MKVGDFHSMDGHAARQAAGWAWWKFTMKVSDFHSMDGHAARQAAGWAWWKFTVEVTDNQIGTFEFQCAGDVIS